MSLKDWEAEVLAEPGAEEEVADLARQMRLAVALTALREQAGLSQREVASRLGVSQPRVAAIERAKNVTIDVLERYIEATGASLEATVVRDGERIPLLEIPHRNGGEAL